MAKAQKTTPVRLTDEAVKWARIASGYTGESMAEYASRVVAERGKEDAGRLHAEATGEQATAAMPKVRKPKAGE
jgi:hypothetical protein